MTKRQFITALVKDKRVLDSTITTAYIYDKRGMLLSIATNSFVKTHPKQAKYAKQANLPLACYLHAEVLAIIRALKRGKPYKIKIERFYKNGNTAIAKPCPICNIAIKEAGISVIEYTI